MGDVKEGYGELKVRSVEWEVGPWSYPYITLTLEGGRKIAIEVERMDLTGFGVEGYDTNKDHKNVEFIKIMEEA